MKNTNILIILFFIIQIQILTYSQDITTDSAKYYLNNYKAACNLDNGKLWGVSLFTHQIVFDKKSRYTVSNFKDTLGILKPDGDLYIGYLPDSIKPQQLGFTTWIHNWPTGSISQSENLGVFVHEAFHSLQDSLKIHPGGCYNNHMTSMDARICLKMEWNFLEQAISAKKHKSVNFIKKAIEWRLYRQKLYPDKVSEERKLELHEGLAQYTGNYIACKYFNTDINIAALRICNQFTESDTSLIFSYVRSFGYASGQFYAILLDKYIIDWKKTLTSDSDLAKILANQLKFKTDTNKLDLFNSYKNDQKYKQIYSEEKAYKTKFDKYQQAIKANIETNTQLIIEKDETFNLSLNPSTLLTFDDGTYYLPYFNASGKWGEIKVSKGGGIFYPKTLNVLLGNNELIIKENEITSTDNWTLTLNKRWRLNKQGENWVVEKNDE